MKTDLDSIVREIEEQDYLTMEHSASFDEVKKRKLKIYKEKSTDYKKSNGAKPDFVVLSKDVNKLKHPDLFKTLKFYEDLVREYNILLEDIKYNFCW